MKLLLLCAAALSVGSALYSGDPNVVQLTEQSFSRVLSSDSVWIVQFFSPGCGHCQSFVAEYKKAARALKGIANVVVVDVSVEHSLAQKYGIKGFPTVKVFGANKAAPREYSGQRTAKALTDFGLEELKAIVSQRLGVKPKPSGGSSSDDVVELTDSNFEQLVLNSKDTWLVEFFAPWCGHCKNLAPHWKSAATELKGKVKLGALDATVHTAMAGKFGIRGFPTIKFFAPGSSANDAVDYEGGRTSSDIVQYAMDKFYENQAAPEVLELHTQSVLDDNCIGKQLCVVLIVPHIFDCQSQCRNEYIGILQKSVQNFKRHQWSWLWLEGMQQPELEQSFGVGGFGYPVLLAFNPTKNKFVVFRGSFGEEGIRDFLRDLSFGRGRTESLETAGLPHLKNWKKWDGLDAELPSSPDDEL